MNRGAQSRIDQGLSPFLEDEQILRDVALIFAPFLAQLAEEEAAAASGDAA